MSREPHVCYYPVFTRSEAMKLRDEALAISVTPEEYLRIRCGMDKQVADVHTSPRRSPGRPPLPPEERIKRETWRAALTKLRRFLAVDAVGTADIRAREKHYAAKEMVRRHETGVEEFTWEGFHKMIDLAVRYPQRLHEAPPTKDWPRSGFPKPFEEVENPLRATYLAHQAEQAKNELQVPPVSRAAEQKMERKFSKKGKAK